ncbi:hypothetical protein Amsp01_079390 [Amycolatopsis sp. NBRC 101858]|uniref:hypothetical protein n=1 Tax=Amycolatopsis sp. NBRC 101858 TaxID=3032200 RepID=UPI0024A4FC83|nr:hypothetical protein [Amycolatopsis sp. NBRC 101858]GLY41916.1 hypothetical protein Amsp01_079390 [Amycolatopsis sp. NBRC 101858]
MTEYSLRHALHRMTHRIPGVPAHIERPAGHQGHAPARHHSPARNHSPSRPPRVLAAWQRRIAAFFGQELR